MAGVVTLLPASLVQECKTTAAHTTIATAAHIKISGRSPWVRMRESCETSVGDVKGRARETLSVAKRASIPPANQFLLAAGYSLDWRLLAAASDGKIRAAKER
jgi:hypothetical protein